MEFSPETVTQALYRLSDDGLIRLPHGVPPAMSITTMVDEAAWGRIMWNPPAGNPHLGADLMASRKPTWEEISSAASSEAVKQLRADCENALAMEAQGRIQKCYGASSWREEIEIRLANEHTAAQDAERQRIRTRYRSVLTRIDAAVTVDTLTAIRDEITTGACFTPSTCAHDTIDPPGLRTD